MFPRDRWEQGEQIQSFLPRRQVTNLPYRLSTNIGAWLSGNWRNATSVNAMCWCFLPHAVLTVTVTSLTISVSVPLWLDNIAVGVVVVCCLTVCVVVDPQCSFWRSSLHHHYVTYFEPPPTPDFLPASLFTLQVPGVEDLDYTKITVRCCMWWHLLTFYLTYIVNKHLKRTFSYIQVCIYYFCKKKQQVWQSKMAACSSRN